MSTVAATQELRRLNAEQAATKKTVFGFWVYLMTDCVLFASLFATYAVLRNNTFGGPSGRQLFDLPNVLVETLILLTSSFTCGIAMLAAQRRNRQATLAWFGITFLLGLAFLALELTEFRHLVHDGNSWRRSGFLSAFFTLVATHGLHISIGLLWMVVLLVKTIRRGFSDSLLKRLQLLSMFWHFLDVIWIGVFSFVYLLGVLQ